MDKQSSQLSPRSAREEFELLVEECRNLEDLSKMEPLILAGLRRLGRSLAEETVVRVAAAESAPPAGADFSPLGRG